MDTVGAVSVKCRKKVTGTASRPPGQRSFIVAAVLVRMARHLALGLVTLLAAAGEAGAYVTASELTGRSWATARGLNVVVPMSLMGAAVFWPGRRLLRDG